ncbi:hypothetical protein SISSUDRAFT_121495 [Sistotremastrum suecicum HHB10207 ss-3]|uniref:Methyltransferase domain-containing protein n=1 Tax=Sistotremastrum suecicum HHB10207 ss-3 TaxID=1314776 RepID=A0A166B1C4_9AGAM|nr:hypothetical protein SISSUDRAFT_121495 [Sistotremastrum suecicum HHB10207 ss-3]
MRENSVYNELLDLANKYPFRPILLDLGCLMGTDARNLIRDGYNKSGGQILACDLEQRFIDLGYKLYQDGPESTHPTPIRFFTGDIFKMSIAPPTEATEHGRDLPQNLTLDGVKGKLDFVYAGALFHLFDEPTQRDLAFRLARLIQMPSDSSGQLPDAIIFGRHAGLDEEGYISGHFVGGRWGQRYGHSPTSWVRLWKSIYTELYGHEWVEENIQANAVMQRINTKVKMLFWSVRIKRSYR